MVLSINTIIPTTTMAASGIASRPGVQDFPSITAFIIWLLTHVSMTQFVGKAAQRKYLIRRLRPYRAYTKVGGKQK